MKPNNDPLMWTVKYRPKKLDAIVGNKSIIASIKSMMPFIPHLLFKGPPGVGKTTTALAIVEELGCDVLEINASDESGIDVVRGKIKSFAGTGALNGKFKIVILDEADETTTDFQTALRRTMEKNASNCKFIFTCNEPQRIIEPIHSRCQGGEFEFQLITFEEFKVGIRDILIKENMTIDEDALIKLYDTCQGDMRVVDKLYNISFHTKHITMADITDIQDNDTWKELLKLIQAGKYTEACKVSNKKQIVPVFHALFVSDISDEKKMKIAKYVADWEFKSHFAKTDYIQTYALIANFIAVLKEDKVIRPISAEANAKVIEISKSMKQNIFKVS